MKTGESAQSFWSGRMVLIFSLWAVSIFVVYVTATSREAGSVFCVNNEYPFTNARLNCLEEDEFSSISQVENKVRHHIDDLKKRNPEREVSVFFRNLKTTQWFGVKENESFAPGSLLKIPLAVSYLKYTEVQPDLLDTQYVFNRNGEISANQREYFKPPEDLQDGVTYSIAELIHRMISYSDNDAVIPLIEGINKDYYNRVLIDLGIILPKEGGAEQEFVSVRSYANIFRMLYNASYMDRKRSEYLLSLMAESTFKEGLVAGVPSGVVVSHKFGERVLVAQETGQKLNIQLHDCGIVYKTGTPYLLCVMTEGAELDVLKHMIRDVSRIVYEEV